MRSSSPGFAAATTTERCPWPLPEATTQLPSAPTPPVASSALLAQITADLAVGDDLRELLQRFLDPIVALANAQAGAVRVLSSQGDRLELVGSSGLPQSVREHERLVDSRCGCCGEAAAQRRVIWASDLACCVSRNCGEYFGQACRHVMAVPLVHRNRVLGVYNLFFADDKQPGPETAALLRSIGDLLGIALDNLRLEGENLRATVTHERQTIAAEIHDAVAQNLTFVDMRLPLLRDAIEAHEQERALKYLDEVRETLGDAHTSLRQIVTQFRTRMDALGLARALGALAARFSARTGIDLKLANGMPNLQLTEEEELDIFHIVQEALANVEKHAHAQRVWVSVEPTLAGVVVRIEDDGVGPRNPEGAPQNGAHYGMDIMSERAGRLGGDLTVSPRAGGGTQVRLAVPIGKPSGVAA
jgi:two-component system, NarL family, nitrate/nitrite sensor histidine kinase NarX